MSDYPHIERLESDLNDHGHAHVTVAERPGDGDEIDCSAGNTTFDYDAGLITVETNDDTWRFAMGDVVAWYCPSGL